MRRLLKIFFLFAALLTLSSCSVTRYVPEGKYLLESVKIDVRDTTRTLTEKQMMPYVHQRPNNKFLHLTRLRLGVYNLSGPDSTKWWNKWMRKLGEAPVIYDSNSTITDSIQLLKAMNNAGFLHASVRVDTAANKSKKKIKLKYTLNPGLPHIIDSIGYEFPNDSIRELVMRDSARFIVRKGIPLDRGMLEEQREWITSRLRNRGYWAFTKEFITFNADTTQDSRSVELTMSVRPPYEDNRNAIKIDTHKKYLIRNITYVTDYNSTIDNTDYSFPYKDSVRYKDINILYSGKHYLRPEVLFENCFLEAGKMFRERDITNTYSALGRLSILKFVQIRLRPVGNLSDTGLLDAYILLTPGKSQSISVEVEGTNSEGDLGVALGLNYTHRNAGRGSETLNFKVRGSYQSVSGNLEGFIHNRFMEYGVELALTFPKFKAPFLKDSFKRQIKASTELHVSMNYQERPEYTRIISTAGWSYKWTEHNARYRYTFTPIDINYVYLPKSTYNFIDQIAPDNPLLRYSYEDHFIMRAGFNYYYTNKRRTTPFSRHSMRDIITVRAQAETAGNVLYGLSALFNRNRKHPEPTENNIDYYKGCQRYPYKVFGINYSQYVRGEVDFSYLHTFDKRNALACYAGIGIGVPYGNSSILPFEKRFYGGGANGVRGWDVRTLGPGRFPGSNSVSDFIYQCGDIKFNMSVEYRAKLFWVVEGALFIDAGNIWTIHSYATQPYGMFRFNSFYKELAAAYGIGIRLDFNYFLVRLDMGMKAHNPAINQEPWPLIHPRWGRDSSFHFSIGYPF